MYGWSAPKSQKIHEDIRSLEVSCKKTWPLSMWLFYLRLGKRTGYKSKLQTLYDFLERKIQKDGVWTILLHEFMKRAVEDVPKRLGKRIENTMVVVLKFYVMV